MIGTRPDLSYCVGILSRHLENPSKYDWLKVKRVFRYTAGSWDKSIIQGVLLLDRQTLRGDS